MVPVTIALGGNLGDVEEAFRQAADVLDAMDGVRVLTCSRLYRTQPVGTEAGPPFLNAALALETDLSASRFLSVLQQQETLFGAKAPRHWGARPLDLDLLSYGDEAIQRPDLIVPHPAAWARRFMLDPWHDVAPELAVAGWGATVGELRRRLLRRPLTVRLPLAWGDPPAVVANDLLEWEGNLEVLPETDDAPLATKAIPWDARFVLPDDPWRATVNAGAWQQRGPVSWLPRWRLVQLPRNAPEEMVRQILRGMLDEPRVIAAGM